MRHRTALNPLAHSQAKTEGNWAQGGYEQALRCDGFRLQEIHTWNLELFSMIGGWGTSLAPEP